jgi:hypothetical protein
VCQKTTLSKCHIFADLKFHSVSARSRFRLNIKHPVLRERTTQNVLTRPRMEEIVSDRAPSSLHDVTWGIIWMRQYLKSCTLYRVSNKHPDSLPIDDARSILRSPYQSRLIGLDFALGVRSRQGMAREIFDFPDIDLAKMTFPSETWAYSQGNSRVLEPSIWGRRQTEDSGVLLGSGDSGRARRPLR